MKIKLNKLRKCMYTLLISMVCFLFTAITTEAKELDAEIGVVEVVNFNNTTEDIPAEIKEPIEKGLSLLEYLVVTIGIVAILVGIVLLGISFFGHQNDMKITGFIALGAGIIITLAPFVAHWIAGR